VLWDTPSSNLARPQSFAQAAVRDVNGTGVGNSVVNMGYNLQQQQQVNSLDPSEFPALGAAVGSHFLQQPSLLQQQQQQQQQPHPAQQQQPTQQQNFSQVAQGSLFTRMDNSSPAPAEATNISNNTNSSSRTAGGPPGLAPSKVSSQAVGGNRSTEAKKDGFSALPDSSVKVSVRLKSFFF
jgi:hypothetical protein